MRTRYMAAGVACFGFGYGLAFAHLQADGTSMGLAIFVGALAVSGVCCIGKAQALPRVGVKL